MLANNLAKYLSALFCLVMILIYVDIDFSISQSTPNSTVISSLNTRNILDGFDYFEGEVIIGNQKVKMQGIIVNPKKYQLAVTGLNPETYSGYTLGGFEKRSDALAVITGGFRSAQNLPLGLVIEDGKVFNRIAKNPSVITGILTISRDKVDIIHHTEYRASENYQYALQSGPIIVKKGGINGIHRREKEIKWPFSRSFIAIQNTGNIVLALTSSVYLYDLAEFLRDSTEHGLNCNVALNLEGGGGEGLIISTDNMSESFGNVRVRRPNAIIVKKF